MPITKSISNPELRTHSISTDEKWEKRIEKQRDRLNDAPADSPDEKGERVVTMMELAKDASGLGGLRNRRVGFSKEEYEQFKPVPLTQTGPAAFDGIVLPEEMEQSLSNCYWAAARLAISEVRPDYVCKQVQPVTEEEKKKLPSELDWYTATVFPRFMGIRYKAKIEVANSFPYSRLSPADGAVGEDRLRHMLYEKGFAGWEGGYRQLAWGNAGRAMGNMTGTRVKYLLLPLKSEDAVWNRLMRKQERKEAVVAVVMNHYDYLSNLKFLPQSMRDSLSEKAADRNPSSVGLTNKHCYSVRIAEEKVEKRVVQADGTETIEETLERVAYLRDPRNPETPKRVSFSDFYKVALYTVSARVPND